MSAFTFPLPPDRSISHIRKQIRAKVLRFFLLPLLPFDSAVKWDGFPPPPSSPGGWAGGLFLSLSLSAPSSFLFSNSRFYLIRNPICFLSEATQTPRRGRRGGEEGAEREAFETRFPCEGLMRKMLPAFSDGWRDASNYSASPKGC